jgi:hypothetical protein
MRNKVDISAVVVDKEARFRRHNRLKTKLPHWDSFVFSHSKTSRTLICSGTYVGLGGRYGLVLVILWIGAMKFTAYEANVIQPLVANSPLMGWLYRFLSVQEFSDSLGVVEIAIAVMIGMICSGTCVA